MKVGEFDLKADDQRFIRIYPIGDMHLEKHQFDEKRFKRYVEDIASDPHGMWCFVGDAIEGRTPDMAKYDPDATKNEYKGSDYLFRIQEKLSELFKPLRNRPGMVVKGNHDEYLKWAGVSNYLASVSGGLYLDGEGMVRVNCDLGGKSRSLVVYARHVIGGGQTQGGKLNSASKMAGLVDADVYLAGHIHSYAGAITPSYTLPRRGKLALVSRDVAVHVATSFLVPKMEGHVDYTGKKGYTPPDRGLVFLKVNLETMNIYRGEMMY